MTKKTLKKEYQPGGEKRYVILDKAVQYLKDPKFGLQGDKRSFLMEELGLSDSDSPISLVRKLCLSPWSPKRGSFRYATALSRITWRFSPPGWYSFFNVFLVICFIPF